MAAAGAVIAVAGAIGWWGPSTGGPAAPADAAGRQPAPAADAGRPARPVLAPREPGAPRQVRIPELGVVAPVVPVRAPGRTLVPPSDPRRLGWWAGGARPGAARGSALVAGHTVHTGGGALDRLEDLRRGDDVVVRTHRGQVAYVVQRVRVYSKGSLARHATDLFSQDVPGRLVLITCEDWDGERYLSNVVVIATPRA